MATLTRDQFNHTVQFMRLVYSKPQHSTHGYQKGGMCKPILSDSIYFFGYSYLQVHGYCVSVSSSNGPVLDGSRGNLQDCSKL